jgi:hypothetical protein
MRLLADRLLTTFGNRSQSTPNHLLASTTIVNRFPHSFLISATSKKQFPPLIPPLRQIDKAAIKFSRDSFLMFRH